MYGNYGNNALGSLSYIPGIHQKDFYCSAAVTLDSTKDFYLNASQVLQPTPTIPLGLTATDQVKGDLVKLAWTDDSNYGYNVYRTNPGGRLKLNSYPVLTNEFLVGNLTTNTAYTFVITGINGAEVESADSASATATPTFPDYAGGASRFSNFTFEIKVNGSTRSDAFPQTIELGYGTSPAVARFTITKDPSTPGLPVLNDTVDCYINGKRKFRGIIKNIEKSVSSSGMAVSYIAFSKVIERTYESVSQDYINKIKKDYNLDVTDQTWLQAYETVANQEGNYRIFYDMENDVVEKYKLGTGFWNRTVTIGKNVIEWNITEDISSKVTKVTLIGARKRITVPWQDLSFFHREIETLNVPTLRMWIDYYVINAYNIADIQVETYQSLTQPDIRYNEEISVYPTDCGLTKWQDGTVESKKVVTNWFNPPGAWQSASNIIEYIYEQVGNEQVPVSAILTLTCAPRLFVANIQTAHAVRKGRVPAEDVEIGWIHYALPTHQFGCPFRISYSYEETTPISFVSGSGSPSRTVTDTQYLIEQNLLKGTDNTAEINTAIAERSQSELDKVGRPNVNGRIKIIGDEEFNLKTLVSINGELLDVVRVTHDFTNGFTTDIELTNEKFRINIPSYQEQRRNVEYQRKTTGTQTFLGYIARKIQQSGQTPPTLQIADLNIPKSPFGVYSD